MRILSHTLSALRRWVASAAVFSAVVRLLAVGLLTAGLMAAGLLAGAAPGVASPAARPCASYPTPGSVAPAGTAVPKTLVSRYGLFRRSQRAVDRIARNDIGGLSASGLILSGSRFVGKGAFGARIYVIPAEHLLGFRIAPARCLPPDQRGLEKQLLPHLRREYRHIALCVVVLNGQTGSPSCASAAGSPEALLYSSGTPGFGLVPNGVRAVTVTYTTESARTVPVHDNFFLIIARKRSAAPCGVQWLDTSGSVINIPVGCSYVPAEEAALATYRTYVSGELTTLQAQVDALAAAVGSGDDAQAQSAWLTAHLTWLDIGQDDGAYGCFGALGGEIDGLAGGDPGGPSSPAFTGFHRIEYDLWTTHDLAAAATDTAKLQSLLATLVEAPLTSFLPSNPASVANWVLRPHEVLEDALRDSLSGDDDYGSGTDLASVTADVAAVRELLGDLRPLLNPLSPGLVTRAENELTKLVTDAAATQVNGAWVALSAIPALQRQQVDADIGAALEALAPVPDLLTSTGTNAPIT